MLEDLGKSIHEIFHPKFRSSHFSNQTCLKTNNDTVAVKNPIYQKHTMGLSTEEIVITDPVVNNQ